MKKIFIIVLTYVLLAAIGFGGGFLGAKQKVARETQKKMAEDVSLEIPKEVLENKDEVEKEDVAEDISSTDSDTSPQASSAQIEDETEFSFAILGDTQYFKPGASGGFQSAVTNIKKLKPDLVFAVGDLVGSCDGTVECEGKLNAWKNILAPASAKPFVTQGNHDRTGGEKAGAAWEKVFNYLPTNGPVGFARFAYSFDRENSHFVVLDSDKPKENDINGKQLDWLEQDLTQNKKTNIFVFFHEPAYPTNSKIGESLDKNPGNRDRLWSILTKHKAKAVFSGHEHIQSRRQANGLYQFGFGNTEAFNHLAPKAGMAEYFHIGQAFGLVEVKGKEITVKTYSVAGNLLNSFALAK